MFDGIINLAKKWGGMFAIHGVNDTVWDKLSGEVKSQAIKGLQSKLFGIGTTDEVLTGEAFILAIKILMGDKTELDPTDLAKITMVWTVMAELSPTKRNKLTSIVGHGQQRISEEGSMVNGIKISWKETVNIRGAELILMLCKLPSKNAMRVALKAMGSLDTGIGTFFAMLKEGAQQIGLAIDFGLKTLDSNVELNDGITTLTNFLKRKTAETRRKSLI